MPLPEAIIEEVGRLSRKVEAPIEDLAPADIAAAALVEAPIYRHGEELKPWQRAFVAIFLEHPETYGIARLLLANEVGVGKTLSLATSAMVACLPGDQRRPIGDVDADQAQPFARDVERVTVENSDDAFDGLVLAARCANADAGQLLLEDVANTSAADDAGERPDAGPGPAGNQLSRPLVVDVSNGGETVDWIGVDVDALGGGGIGEGDERDRNGGRGMRANHRANMPAIRDEQ